MWLEKKSKILKYFKAYIELIGLMNVLQLKLIVRMT